MKPTDEDVRTAWEATVPHTATAKNIRAALEAYTPRLIERLAKGAEDMCAMDPETGIRGEKRKGEDGAEYLDRIKAAEGAVKFLRSHIGDEHD